MVGDVHQSQVILGKPRQKLDCHIKTSQKLAFWSSQQSRENFFIFSLHFDEINIQVPLLKLALCNSSFMPWLEVLDWVLTGNSMKCEDSVILNNILASNENLVSDARFLKETMNIIDMVAICPFYISLILEGLEDFEIIGKTGKMIRLVGLLFTLYKIHQLFSNS